MRRFETRGHFDFTVEAFADPVARQIREALAAPPPGVEVRISREDEETNPETGEAARVELYAPLHCHAYRAWGTVSGPLPGLTEMHRRLRELPFVYEGGIEIDAHPADPAEPAPRPGG